MFSFLSKTPVRDILSLWLTRAVARTRIVQRRRNSTFFVTIGRSRSDASGRYFSQTSIRLEGFGDTSYCDYIPVHIVKFFLRPLSEIYALNATSLSLSFPMQKLGLRFEIKILSFKPSWLSFWKTNPFRSTRLEGCMVAKTCPWV